MAIATLSATLSHWCQTNGLYAKQTFISLFGCLIRMVREHRMSGMVLTHINEGFEGLTDGLLTLPDCEHVILGRDNFMKGEAHLPGLLLILTDRLCCLLYWRPDTEPTFQLYEGGWTFHPAEVRHIAESLMSQLIPASLSDRLIKKLHGTQLDRRYDDRLSTMIPSLVQGLEQRNRELTLALSELQNLHERMVQAERLAAIGQVSATIAHEIRNPLGLIDLYAKLAEGHIAQVDCSSAQKQKLLDPVQQILSAASHLETFLGELSDYSKPFQLQCAPTVLADMAQQVVQFCQPLADKHGVLLSLADPPAAWRKIRLNIDSARLQQALLNLIKNAIEATHEAGAVQVSIASRKQDDQIFIKVCDQGGGVQKQQQGKLFTPFFTTKSQGTGLGLARSQKILQAHGGSVKLLTSSPKGSTFALVLPKNRLWVDE